MSSGPIIPKLITQKVERRDVELELWEKSNEAAVELPWRSAAELESDDVQGLLVNAETAVLAAGASATGRALLDLALSEAPAKCRLYVYTSRTRESDIDLRKRFSAVTDRVLPRLGFDLPADWLVVDGGRAGYLFIGPPGGPRRWMLSLDGALARSLFEAFRALFWFHSSREALPEGNRPVEWSSPSPAPFEDPGATIVLPAGHVGIHMPVPHSIQDADLRIVHGAVPPGRAATIFIAPNTRDFDTPRKLARDGARALWVDAGLPNLSITKQRMVMDLVADPVSLQLEWPKTEAIDFYHRLSKLAQRATWSFHPARKLADVAGSVLLPGAAAPADVVDAHEIELGELTAGLIEFETMRPNALPDPPKLAKRVTYRWTLKPPHAPSGAGAAGLIREWKALDEWADRELELARGALKALDSDERSFLGELKRWLTGYDGVRSRARSLSEQLVELGEVRPSQRGPEAKDVVSRIAAASGELKDILAEAYAQRGHAEQRRAEERQRAEWEARKTQMTEELESKKKERAALAVEEDAARVAEAEAVRALEAALGPAREERRALFAAELERVSVELERARTEAERHSKGPKEKRKQTARAVQDLERQRERAKADLEQAGAWRGHEAEHEAERKRLRDAQASVEHVAQSVRELDKQLEGLSRDVGKPFVFAAPPGTSAPTVPSAKPPTIPTEALPELGELVEHRGKRYLIVKTWEQVSRALPVAKRLNCELVAST